MTTVKKTSLQNIWVVFLSGGQGKRMRPYTANTSKALIPLINNFPIAEAIIFNLSKLLNLKNIAFGAKGLNNYKDLQSFFQGGSGWSAKHHISPQTNFEYQHPNYQDKGSADCARYNIGKFNIKTPILVVATDGLHDPEDIKNLIKFSEKTSAPFIMGINKTNNPSEYGIATKINKGGLITEFIEKPKDKKIKTGWANNGIYLIKPEVFPYLQSDFGKDTIPTLISQGKVAGFKFKHPWLDFGNPVLHLQNSLYILNKQPEYFLKFIKTSHKKINKNLWIRGKSKIALKFSRQIIDKIKTKKIKITGKVIIGKECVIGDNVILENCSIGDYCEVRDNCVIKNSNIMDGWNIEESVVIKSSLFGRIGQASHHCNIENSFLNHNVHLGHHRHIKNKILKG
jgi:NDP-sugar pyrophosphorylase family protein